MIGQRERGRAWVGAIAIGAVALGAIGLAWWMGSSGPAEPPLRPRDREADEPVERSPSAGAPSDPTPAGAPEPPVPVPSPEVTADLAARLARALDGGVRPPADEPGASVPPAPPQPRLRLDRPPTASEQREFAGRLHDWIVLRRDELRRRLAELEESGQGAGTQAERVRWELRRLDEHEPAAARQVEELAERVRQEEAAREESAAGAP